MSEDRADRLTRLGGLGFTLVYAALIGWLFVRQPQTVAQITGGLASTIGVYSVDQQAFADGLQFFRNDQFVEARMAFARADPAIRDARTQFYIAYSYYRQGWGRITNDDALFKTGLEAVERVSQIDRDYVSKDPDLRLKTAAELKNEFEEGLKVTADDFNPLRLVRERK